MDFVFAVALLGVLFYLILRTRRMKLRLVESDEPKVQKTLIIIKHSFDEEAPVITEMATAVPAAVVE